MLTIDCGRAGSRAQAFQAAHCVFRAFRSEAGLNVGTHGEGHEFNGSAPWASGSSDSECCPCLLVCVFITACWSRERSVCPRAAEGTSRGASIGRSSEHGSTECQRTERLTEMFISASSPSQEREALDSDVSENRTPSEGSALARSEESEVAQATRSVTQHAVQVAGDVSQ